MKTTKLMTAFALSAMFAACSQDAELNETLAKNDFSNIPMVEAEFTANVGTDSRMATKFGWETGDKVGFAWLGDATISASNTSGMAYQNHPLFCSNPAKSAFKTETMLYVGEYFAYMPYTAGDMAVENIAFSIAEQPLTTDANVLAKQAIYLSTENALLEKADAEGNVTEGSQKAGMGNNVKLNLALLNNPATIKLAFKNIEALAGLKITGAKVSIVNQNGTDVMPISFLHNGQIEDWTELTAKQFFTTNSTYTSGSVALKGELAVSANNVKTYALLLPAVTVLTPSLKIELTTNYGTVVAENVKVDNAKIYKYFGESATVTADVDGEKISNNSCEVKTQAELVDVLNKLTATEQTADVLITLNPETASTPAAPFTLTNFTLPANLKATIGLVAGNKTNGEIVFAGSTTINKMVQLHSNAKVTGEMTVNNIKVNNVQQTTLWGHTLTVDNNAALVNEGMINLNVVTTAKTTTKAAGLYISNATTAKFESGSLKNYGAAQWILGAKPTMDGNAMYAEATSLENVKAAATAGITEVRLVDGAVIDNHSESVVLDNIANLICSGNVTINITDTYSGVAQTISFPKGVDVLVKEGADVKIVSDNKNNAIDGGISGTIKVEKNAKLSISQINMTGVVVENSGNVTTEKVTGINVTNKQGGTSTDIK